MLRHRTTNLLKVTPPTEICEHRHCFPIEPSISLILRLHMGYLLVFLVSAMVIFEGLSYMLEESRQNRH